MALGADQATQRRLSHLGGRSRRLVRCPEKDTTGVVNEATRHCTDAARCAAHRGTSTQVVWTKVMWCGLAVPAFQGCWRYPTPVEYEHDIIAHGRIH
jgi:hypothetical protein